MTISNHPIRVAILTIILLLQINLPTANAKLPSTELTQHSGKSQISLDEKYLASIASHKKGKTKNGYPITTQELNLFTLQPYEKKYGINFDESYFARSVTIDRNNKFIALAAMDGYVDVFNLADGSRKFRLLPSKKLVKTYALGDGGLEDTGRKKYDSVLTVAYSPTEDILISANIKGTITLWNSNTGELIKSVKGSMIGQDDATFTSDGKLFALRSILSAQVKIWSAETGKVLHKFDKTEGIRIMRFSADNQKLLMLDIENKLVIWDFINDKYSSNFDGNKNSSSAVMDFHIIDHNHLLLVRQKGEVEVLDLSNFEIKQKEKVEIEVDIKHFQGQEIILGVYFSEYLSASKQLMITTMKGTRHLVDLKKWLENSENKEDKTEH